MKEVIMFKCDHCKKKYASKYRTRDHEKECWKNPETKSCNTCYWNTYENNVRSCTVMPRFVSALDYYPQQPVMRCKSWKAAYEYQEEEYE